MQFVRKLKIENSGTLPSELHQFLKPTDPKSVTVGNSFSNQRISWMACEDKLAIINNVNSGVLLKIDLSDYLPDFSTITCGEEVTLPGFSSALLVLGCETNLGGLLLFYHPTLRRMIRIVEVDVGVAVINIFSNGYKDNPLLPDFLACMDGVLAVGGIDGSVILVDLHYTLLKRALKSERDSSNNSLAWPSKIFKLHYISRLTDNWHSLKVKTELCNKTYDSLAFLLNDKEGELLAPRHGNTYSSVTCLHYCPIVAALFVGYEVGVWQMWSIIDFKLLYNSKADVGLAVVGLSLLEPCDDPRHYLYLWVGHSRTSRPAFLHRNASRAPGSPPTSPVSSYPPLVPSCQEPPFSLLYSLAFVKKTNVDEYGPLYSEFYKCDDIFELEMVQEMETFNSGRILSVDSLICANPYRKYQSNREDDIELLRVWSIIWECEFEEVEGRTIYVTLFDLNQWYNKMPGQPDVVLGQSSKSLPIQDTPFLSTWFLPPSDFEDEPLSLRINPQSLEAFRYLNQLECHYYPSNISFSFVKVGSQGICSGEGMSVVNEFKEKLKFEPAGCMACPEPMFHTCLSLGILPNFDDTSSIHSITLNADIARRYLLTICVENGLIDVILGCARYWYDSACTETAVSLDFLVDFLWDLFTTYNRKIDELCISLFDYSGIELNYLDNVRMKLLNQHMKDIKTIYASLSRDYSTFNKIYIVNHRYFAIDIRTFYVDLVIWFTSHNFLPESPSGLPCDSIRPYNYETMKHYINSRRGKNPLLIDEMLVHWISGEVKEWKKETGEESLVYPPSSIQDIIRISLLADVDAPLKHFFILYFLQDLLSCLSSEKFNVDPEAIIKNYEATFMIHDGQMRIVLSYRDIDCKHYKEGIERLLHRTVKNCDIDEWEHRHIIKTLYDHREYSLAFRYLKGMQPPLGSADDIKMEISLNVSLGNVSSAFFITQQWLDKRSTLLKHFFQECVKMNKIKFIYPLPLDKYEEDSFLEFLQTSGIKGANDLMLYFYIDRHRYPEAFVLYDKMKRLGQCNGLDKNSKKRNMLMKSLEAKFDPKLLLLQKSKCEAKNTRPPSGFFEENWKPTSHYLKFDDSNPKKPLLKSSIKELAFITVWQGQKLSRMAPKDNKNMDDEAAAPLVERVKVLEKSELGNLSKKRLRANSNLIGLSKKPKLLDRLLDKMPSNVEEPVTPSKKNLDFSFIQEMVSTPRVEQKTPRRLSPTPGPPSILRVRSGKKEEVSSCDESTTSKKRLTFTLPSASDMIKQSNMSRVLNLGNISEDNKSEESDNGDESIQALNESSYRSQDVETTSATEGCTNEDDSSAEDENSCESDSKISQCSPIISQETISEQDIPLEKRLLELQNRNRKPNSFMNDILDNSKEDGPINKDVSPITDVDENKFISNNSLEPVEHVNKLGESENCNIKNLSHSDSVAEEPSLIENSWQLDSSVHTIAEHQCNIIDNNSVSSDSMDKVYTSVGAPIRKLSTIFETEGENEEPCSINVGNDHKDNMQAVYQESELGDEKLDQDCDYNIQFGHENYVKNFDSESENNNEDFEEEEKDKLVDEETGNAEYKEKQSFSQKDKKSSCPEDNEMSSDSDVICLDSDSEDNKDNFKKISREQSKYSKSDRSDESSCKSSFSRSQDDEHSEADEYDEESDESLEEEDYIEEEKEESDIPVSDGEESPSLHSNSDESDVESILESCDSPKEEITPARVSHPSKKEITSVSVTSSELFPNIQPSANDKGVIAISDLEENDNNEGINPLKGTAEVVTSVDISIAETPAEENIIYEGEDESQHASIDSPEAANVEPLVKNDGVISSETVSINELQKEKQYVSSIYNAGDNDGFHQESTFDSPEENSTPQVDNAEVVSSEAVSMTGLPVEKNAISDISDSEGNACAQQKSNFDSTKDNSTLLSNARVISLEVVPMPEPHDGIKNISDISNAESKQESFLDSSKGKTTLAQNVGGVSSAAVSLSEITDEKYISDISDAEDDIESQQKTSSLVMEDITSTEGKSGFVTSKVFSDVEPSYKGNTDNIISPESQLENAEVVTTKISPSIVSSDEINVIATVSNEESSLVKSISDSPKMEMVSQEGNAKVETSPYLKSDELNIVTLVSDEESNDIQKNNSFLDSPVEEVVQSKDTDGDVTPNTPVPHELSDEVKVATSSVDLSLLEKIVSFSKTVSEEQLKGLVDVVKTTFDTKKCASVNQSEDDIKNKSSESSSETSNTSNFVSSTSPTLPCEDKISIEIVSSNSHNSEPQSSNYGVLCGTVPEVMVVDSLPENLMISSDACEVQIDLKVEPNFSQQNTDGLFLTPSQENGLKEGDDINLSFPKKGEIGDGVVEKEQNILEAVQLLPVNSETSTCLEEPKIMSARESFEKMVSDTEPDCIMLDSSSEGETENRSASEVKDKTHPVVETRSLEHAELVGSIEEIKGDLNDSDHKCVKTVVIPSSPEEQSETQLGEKTDHLMTEHFNPQKSLSPDKKEALLIDSSNEHMVTIIAGNKTFCKSNSENNSMKLFEIKEDSEVNQVSSHDPGVGDQSSDDIGDIDSSIGVSDLNTAMVLDESCNLNTPVSLQKSFISQEHRKKDININIVKFMEENFERIDDSVKCIETIDQESETKMSFADSSQDQVHKENKINADILETLEVGREVKPKSKLRKKVEMVDKCIMTDRKRHSTRKSNIGGTSASNSIELKDLAVAEKEGNEEKPKLVDRSMLTDKRGIDFTIMESEVQVTPRRSKRRSSSLQPDEAKFDKQNLEKTLSGSVDSIHMVQPNDNGKDNKKGSQSSSCKPSSVSLETSLEKGNVKDDSSQGPSNQGRVIKKAIRRSLKHGHNENDAKTSNVQESEIVSNVSEADNLPTAEIDEAQKKPVREIRKALRRRSSVVLQETSVALVAIPENNELVIEPDNTSRPVSSLHRLSRSSSEADIASLQDDHLTSHKKKTPKKKNVGRYSSAEDLSSESRESTPRRSSRVSKPTDFFSPSSLASDQSDLIDKKHEKKFKGKMIDFDDEPESSQSSLDVRKLPRKSRLSLRSHLEDIVEVSESDLDSTNSGEQFQHHVHNLRKRHTSALYEPHSKTDLTVLAMQRAGSSRRRTLSSSSEPHATGSDSEHNSAHYLRSYTRSEISDSTVGSHLPYSKIKSRPPKHSDDEDVLPNKIKKSFEIKNIKSHQKEREVSEDDSDAEAPPYSPLTVEDTSPQHKVCTDEEKTKVKKVSRRSKASSITEGGGSEHGPPARIRRRTFSSSSEPPSTAKIAANVGQSNETDSLKRRKSLNDPLRHLTGLDLLKACEQVKRRSRSLHEGNQIPPYRPSQVEMIHGEDTNLKHPSGSQSPQLAEIIDEYSENRRLTRHQKSLIERSFENSPRTPELVTTPKRRRRSSVVAGSEDESTPVRSSKRLQEKVQKKEG